MSLVFALVAVPSSSVHAGRKRVPNMPRGWTWPPSPQMRAQGKACLEDLDKLGIEYRKAKPARKIATPIELPELELGAINLEATWRKPPFVMDCHLARALAKRADEIAALGIVALRFSTIHKYRTIKRKGRPTKILSRHAIGLAMDMFEVRLEDGTRLAVEDDYRDPKSPLHKLEQLLASDPDLRTPLTPGNDPKGHDDHFHLEARMHL